jgi:ligand-binding SRPBCC domain-containing protein
MSISAKALWSSTKEDKGFEPLHGFTRLTVFKTVPFSRTWVILHEYKNNMTRTGIEPVLPP